MGERTDTPLKDSDLSDIRRDIARTQRELAETIDEIQYRLSPDHIMEQTKEKVRRAGVRTSRKMIDRIKENPIPTAMVGMGLWMLMRDRGDSYDYDTGYDFDYATSDVEGRRFGRSRYTPYTSADSLGNRGYGSSNFNQTDEGMTDRLKDRAGDVADRVSGTMHDARERTSEAMHNLGDKASDLGHDAADRMRDLGHETSERMRDMRHEAAIRARRISRRTSDFMSESPMVAGLAAIAIGAIIGAIIPESRKEHELMGETRDRLAERGREMVSEGIDTAKEAAANAAEAAKDTVKESTESHLSRPSNSPATGSSAPGSMTPRSEPPAGRSMSSGNSPVGGSSLGSGSPTPKRTDIGKDLTATNDRKDDFRR
jgi:ElaB/YqjD/DUF883 family membrane-anchored ribosome-binding protein